MKMTESNRAIVIGVLIMVVFSTGHIISHFDIDI
jgi:hypothetical protein